MVRRFTHLDPEIHPDPHAFRWDRFLGRDGPQQFLKRGTRIPIPLLAFSSGARACPGRSLARNEIKLFIATLLARYDVELTTPSVPPLMLSRVGLGVVPPHRDVPFRRID